MRKAVVPCLGGFGQLTTHKLKLSAYVNSPRVMVSLHCNVGQYTPHAQKCYASTNNCYPTLF